MTPNPRRLASRLRTVPLLAGVVLVAAWALWRPDAASSSRFGPLEPVPKHTDIEQIRSDVLRTVERAREQLIEAQAKDQALKRAQEERFERQRADPPPLPADPEAADRKRPDATSGQPR